MKIGAYTTLEEICKSTTAIRHGIDNKPDAVQLHAIKLLAEKIYDPLCNYLGKPIPYNSWFRSPILNSIIGGAASSQHCKGEAVDLDLDRSGLVTSNSVLFHYILNNLPFDQLIWEFGNDQNPAWVHVSYSEYRQRKEVLRIRSKAEGYQVWKP